MASQPVSSRPKNLRLLLPGHDKTTPPPPQISKPQKHVHQPDPNSPANAPRPILLRAKTDLIPRAKTTDLDSRSDGDAVIRHGFETQLASPEWTNLLTSHFYLYYTDKKHENSGKADPNLPDVDQQEWRMKDRLKTVAAILALYLNIGVDPPDIVKPNPCATEICWRDPFAIQFNPNTGGTHPLCKDLQSQYEDISMRTRYHPHLDMTTEKTKKNVIRLRKDAKAERVLFHYNGLGVPKPTAPGEVWVFNTEMTQYVPLPIKELQTWIGGPTIFVWDCSEAGIIIENYMLSSKNFMADLTPENTLPLEIADCIHFAACSQGQSLPSNPHLPADLFTCCLTTPIRMAIKYFLLQNPLKNSVPYSNGANIPGKVTDRRTPLGELNWIFTAITDSIAWAVLDKTLFKRLFRQDLMVAALYRNFLLAQRIMRKYLCTPFCYPEIPQCHNHPLWDSWDLAVEAMLIQLPYMLNALHGGIPYDYQHSNFFAEQLTAFELYLSQEAALQKSPEQLPVLLQVLLSQVHRLRAVILLSKFLDLGPWAAKLALGIGIFPYILKLLQSQALELKPIMIFIWARIMAVDQSCQADLLRQVDVHKDGFQYFVNVFNPNVGGDKPFSAPISSTANQNSMLTANGLWAEDVLTYMARLGYPIDWVHGVPNIPDHRAMCAFVLAMFCRDYPVGQKACLSPELISSCLHHLEDKDHPLLRQWSCLCLGMLWANHPEARVEAIKHSAHRKLCNLVIDCVAEVRSAMIYALTNFINMPEHTPESIAVDESIIAMLLVMVSDGNSMVRKELLVFFSVLVSQYINRFLVVAFEQLVDDYGPTTPGRKVSSYRDSLKGKNSKLGRSPLYSAVWKEILILTADPYPEIAENACQVVDSTYDLLMQSELGSHAAPWIELAMQRQNSKPPPSKSAKFSKTSALPREVTLPPTHEMSSPPSPSFSARNEGYFTASLKRTASVAASLKNFALALGNSSDLPTRSNGSGPDLATTTTTSKLNTALSSIDRHTQSKPGSYHLPTPAPRDFVSTYLASSPGRPGRTEPLVLESGFFQWAMEYFREPQMQAPEAEEPGSVEYNKRLWRRNRNDGIMAKTQPLKEMAGSSPWNKIKAFFHNMAPPVKMCWHQFEEHLVVSDDKDGISVWNYKQNQRLNHFSNGNLEGFRITQIRLINEDEQAFLMTGSSDGIIKVFRNYESKEKVELVTAFRALTDLEQSTRSAGLVFDWQQSRGQVLVAGDVRSIRVWNAGTEICTDDIDARSSAPITSLTSDQVEGNLFVAGFGDGGLRLYDQRIKPQSALVQVWKEHKAWITNVHLQRGGLRELISASRNGDVRLWDIRSTKSIRTIQAMPVPHRAGAGNSGATVGGLRYMAVHEHAPVIAVGAADSRIVKVYNTSTGRGISRFEPYGGRFLGSGGNGGVRCLSFHPHRMMCAASTVNESYVTVFGCGKKGYVDDEDD